MKSFSICFIAIGFFLSGCRDESTASLSIQATTVSTPPIQGTEDTGASKAKPEAKAPSDTPSVSPDAVIADSSACLQGGGTMASTDCTPPGSSATSQTQTQVPTQMPTQKPVAKPSTAPAPGLPSAVAGGCVTSKDIEFHMSKTGLAPMDLTATGANNNHFCVHTVTNGNARLSDGLTILGPSTGLQIAIADSASIVPFEIAPKVCSGLTIGNTNPGDWLPVYSQDSALTPRAASFGISAEAIVSYLQNSNLQAGTINTFYWSGSHTKTYQPGVTAGAETMELAYGRLFCGPDNTNPTSVMCVNTKFVQ